MKLTFLFSVGCLLACFGAAAPAGSKPQLTVEYARYVVLGAGPAGLQFAHYLESAGRDYIVVEKGSSPGGFFERYPRFRGLISINKRFTLTDRLEFALRHDWNSLLCDTSHSGSRRNQNVKLMSTSPFHAYPGGTNSSCSDVKASELDKYMLMRDWSTQYYPHADELTAYLRFYAQHEALRIQYNTTVSKVNTYVATELPGAKRFRDARYVVYAYLPGGRIQAFACRYLIVATGLNRLADIKGSGLHLATTYETMSTNPDDYIDKRVLLIGRGNAAFEAANFLQHTAGQVHLLGNRKRLKLAWESHYPGDIRQVHNRLLEAYQLKAMDGLLEGSIEEVVLVADPHHPGRIYAAAENVTRPVAEGYPPCSGCPMRESYDHVILCPGFRFDTAPFLFDSSRIKLPMSTSVGRGDKYPAMTAQYEAVAAPGLFFVGTLAHTRDHKKTSGGFLHGFRYVARALHRFLEAEERQASAQAPSTGSASVSASTSSGSGVASDAVGWPRVSVPHTRALASAILQRLNIAGGIFQMFGQLVDVFLLSPNCETTHSVEQLAASAGVAPSSVRLASDIDALMNATFLRNAQSLFGPPLCGWYFEEVPLAAVPSFAQQRAVELLSGVEASTGHSDGSVPPVVSYLTISLEFGVNASAPGVDPFRVDRAEVPPAFPERSNFLHPVIRYHDSRVFVLHERQPNHSGMEPWWRRRKDTDAQQPVDNHTDYLFAAKELADEALDAAQWSRVEPLPPSTDLSGLEGQSVVAAVGARSPGFITPVTTFHMVEDFLAKFDLTDRHVAPLLRFLEHVGDGRSALASHVARQLANTQLVTVRDPPPSPQELAVIVAHMQASESPYAWMAAVAGYLPPYPVGYLTHPLLSSTPIPRHLVDGDAAQSTAGSGGESGDESNDTYDEEEDGHHGGAAQADGDGYMHAGVWRDSILAAVLAEHSARRHLFQHLQGGRTPTLLTEPLSRLMATPGAATLYKSDWEMRGTWYDETQDADKSVGVFKVEAGFAWMHMLPIPVRDALLFDGPGSRVLVLLVHAGMNIQRGGMNAADQTRAATSAEKLLRQYASKFPEVAFLDVQLPSPDAPEQLSWDTARLVPGYDGSVMPDHGAGALELVEYLGLDDTEIPALVVLVDTAAAGGTGTGSNTIHTADVRANAAIQAAAQRRVLKGDFGAGYKDELRRAPRQLSHTQSGVTGADVPSATDSTSTSGLTMHVVPIGGRNPTYFDGALHARLLLAGAHANVTVKGLDSTPPIGEGKGAGKARQPEVPFRKLSADHAFLIHPSGKQKAVIGANGAGIDDSDAG